MLTWWGTIALSLSHLIHQAARQLGHAKCKPVIITLYARWYPYIEGILPKGPYLPCVSIAGRALLAGYHRHRVDHLNNCKPEIQQRVAKNIVETVCFSVFSALHVLMTKQRYAQGHLQSQCWTNSGPMCAHYLIPSLQIGSVNINDKCGVLC